MADLGYEGFEQEEGCLHAFAPESCFEEAELRALLARYGLTFAIERIGEQNWNEIWEKSFQPVVVDDFCAVRASFHDPVRGVEHELIITPKMSFGTGHHATTWLMMQAMRHLDFRGRRVLDLGTGTGILAILAERLGAAEVIAIDNDEWSIANALENAAANGCRRLQVQKREEVDGLKGPFGVILANINKHVILEQLTFLRQQLSPGGVVLLSGLLEDDFEDIENEAIRNGLAVSEKMTKAPWICMKTGRQEISS
jgi:ribosomal protein L11 methyltransferase